MEKKENREVYEYSLKETWGVTRLNHETPIILLEERFTYCERDVKFLLSWNESNRVTEGEKEGIRYSVLLVGIGRTLDDKSPAFSFKIPDEGIIELDLWCGEKYTGLLRFVDLDPKAHFKKVIPAPDYPYREKDISWSDPVYHYTPDYDWGMIGFIKNKKGFLRLARESDNVGFWELQDHPVFQIHPFELSIPSEAIGKTRGRDYEVGDEIKISAWDIEINRRPYKVTLRWKPQVTQAQRPYVFEGYNGVYYLNIRQVDGDDAEIGGIGHDMNWDTGVIRELFTISETQIKITVLELDKDPHKDSYPIFEWDWEEWIDRDGEVVEGLEKP